MFRTVSRPHKDSKGYYRALGVAPQASDEEVHLAYALLKGSDEYSAGNGGLPDEIDRAWAVLKSPPQRQIYDRTETASRKLIRVKLNLDDPRLLTACAALLVGLLVFVWVPLYGSRFRSFTPGDLLTDLKGSPFGTVVRSEARHHFANGIFAEAYLIQSARSDELRWYPVGDIQGVCRKAPREGR